MNSRVEDYADAADDPKFAQWMQKVDYAVQRLAGVSVFDLADQPFRDWFEDGMTAMSAAKMTLEEEGF